MFEKPTKAEAYTWNGNTYPTREAALKSEFKAKLKSDGGVGDGTADAIISHLDAVHAVIHEYEECLKDVDHPATTARPAGTGGAGGGCYSDGSPVQGGGGEAGSWGW